MVCKCLSCGDASIWWYIFLTFVVIATWCSLNIIVDTNMSLTVGFSINISLSDRADDIIADASNTILVFIDKLIFLAIAWCGKK